MIPRLAAILGAIAVSCTWSPVQAGLVQISDAEYAISRNQAFDEIASVFELNQEETNAAKSAALTFFYAGPCRGALPDASNSGFGSISIFAGSYEANNKFVNAAKLMYVLLAVENLGREPIEQSCKYAADMTRSGKPIAFKPSYCFYDHTMNSGQPRDSIRLECVSE